MNDMPMNDHGFSPVVDETGNFDNIIDTFTGYEWSEIINEIAWYQDVTPKHLRGLVCDAMLDIERRVMEKYGDEYSDNDETFPVSLTYGQKILVESIDIGR